jgi:hypothetical protein
MRTMRLGCIAGLMALAACASGERTVGVPEKAADSTATAGHWIALFNGKDLAGWTSKFKGHTAGVNYKNTFRVDNGILNVDYSKYEKFNGEFGHLFWKDKLSHYRIRAVYRFVGNQIAGGPDWGFRNNGIMIFSEPPETMELDQDFPASIEVQMLGGGGPGDQNNGSFCTPHTRAVYEGKLTTAHRTSAKSKTYMGDDWVTIEVEVRGGEVINHILDGETVISYSRPQLNPNDAHARRLMAQGYPQMLEGGYIAIQAETHPTQFRSIEILPLD